MKPVDFIGQSTVYVTLFLSFRINVTFWDKMRVLSHAFEGTIRSDTGYKFGHTN